MASLRIAPALRAKAAPSSSRPLVSKRFGHDLIVQPSRNQAPKPVIRHGPPTGGRSSVSGHTVTVFGCTGFLGRYLVHKIAKAGSRVIVPYRDEDEKRHLRVMGDLGQIIPMEWDARNPEQIRECLRYSDMVYNLVGRDWETRNFNYHDANVASAQLIASIAAEHGTPRLVHVSHLNAAPDSASTFYQSKYESERAVRDAFPEATIARPAGMYGAEDWYLNAMARYPILYRLNHGRTKVLPVHVLDVAEALSTMLEAPITSTASTFALPGPAVHTYNSMLSLVASMSMHPPTTAPSVPKPVAKLFASVINRALWWPTVSPDEIERKYIDDFGAAALLAEGAEEKPAGWEVAAEAKQVGVDGEEVKSWKELNIEPDYIEEHAIKYLRRYRSPANFDQPVELGHFKPPKHYHVLP